MSSGKIIRILQIIARLNIGGPAVNVISLSFHLNRKNFQTRIVCGRVGPDEGDMSYLALNNGIEPFYVPELGREISIIDDIRSFIILRKLIKRFKPHIIHTHTAKAGALGRFAGLSMNVFRKNTKRIKFVHTFHGHVFHSYFGILKTFIFVWIEKILALLTDRIIVISSLQKSDICHKYGIAGPEKVREIPFLGFDLSKFKKLSGDNLTFRNHYMSQLDDKVLVVGIIGRLARVKNHRMFLDAVKNIKDWGRIDLFKFIIVGNGELKAKLIDYSRDLAIQDYVSFIGWQEDMPSVYHSLDMVALTSLNEGTPVTLIEAMAAGKPVIATDVGGVRDLFGTTENHAGEIELARNGVLIPSGRSDLLAKALIFLSEEEDLRKNMADNAEDFVFKKFSTEKLVKEMESLYCTLVTD